MHHRSGKTADSDPQWQEYEISHQTVHIAAAFSGFKSGHAMNNKLLRTLLAQPDAWEYVTFRPPSDAPSSFHRLPEAA